MNAPAEKLSLFDWFDVFYLALKLFLLESDGSFGIWQLEIARWLAPIVTSCTAIVGLGAHFREQFKQYRLKSISGHVVVCGLSQKGMQLVRGFRQQGRDVIVIEQDDDNDYIESCKALGAWVLLGDATEKVLLKKARMFHADYIIAVCGQDVINMEIALRVWKQLRVKHCSSKVLRCGVHIENPHLNFLFKQHDVFRETDDSFEVTTFNYTDLVVRQLLKDYPLDRKLFAQDDLFQVQLVLSGFGKVGQALALSAAQRGHYANLQKLRITVVDAEAGALVRQFCTRYPKFDQIVDLDVVQGDMDDPTVINRLQKEVAESPRLATLVLCSDNQETSLVAALQIKDQLASQEMPIRVFLPERGGLDVLFEKDASLTIFGDLSECCTPETVFGALDRLARVIHEDYVHARLKDLDPPKNPESSPKLLPWSRLRSDFRESNRHQADHMSIKLRVIGAEMMPLESARETGPFVFTAEEVELLSHIEHNRWIAERLLGGWNYGPERDDDKRIHNNLVPWEELDEKAREIDRESIRNIPKLVKLSGAQIVRKY